METSRMLNDRQIILELLASHIENASSRIVILYAGNDELISDGDFLQQVISGLKQKPEGADAISRLIALEGNAHRFGKITETHEDAGIQALKEIGGKEAVEALSRDISTYYPTKVIEAIADMDTPYSITTIASIAGVYNIGETFLDLGESAAALNGFVRLHEKIKNDEFKNISQASIIEAVESLSQKILPVISLLENLKGKNSIGDLAFQSLASDIVDGLRNAFLRVDAADITSKKFTPLFNAIVQIHQGIMGVQQQYVELFAPQK